MSRVLSAYVRFLVFLSVVALVAMVILVFGNVVLRYGFSSGITISEELSRWMFVWLVFAGAIVGIHERSHLGVDVLVPHLPAAGKRICAVTSHLLMLICSAVFLAGSWKQVMINASNPAPTTGLSMAWLYGAGVVFGASVVLILITDLIGVLTGRLAGHDPRLVSDAQQDIVATQSGHTKVQTP
jgi:TRAP-type C4-dicarboxylate transport system permease small subunit